VLAFPSGSFSFSITASNEGVKTNRDASLIFNDEIAEYLAEVYDYDWSRLATADPAKARPPRRQARRRDAREVRPRLQT